ncbi:hypothetical protein [Sphingobacterium sp. UBA5980]|uniref:hypothetical protein n=1 Tax=Sphingobacterium sp. UBA5980 TaxID=1947504 RepID=UPI00257FC007|nr:hypothetical protein [Sphingobacterium sp. UBA5980]
MSDILEEFLELKGEIDSINSDDFIYKLKVTKENVDFLKLIYEDNFVECYRIQTGEQINVENIDNLLGQELLIECVTAHFEKIGFYLTKTKFIVSNRFETPNIYYIKDIDYLSSSSKEHEDIQKYLNIVSLISCLISKAKFVSEEHHKNLYLVQDNSFLELTIENSEYEDYFDFKHISIITHFINSINSSQEKRTIFLKELIDYLSTKLKSERLNELLINIEAFVERCDTSYEYYLSNFSFNKIRLELDSAVLEFSKNIRAIINESQSKLIAIPAAFVLAVTQISFSSPYSLKSILIVLSTFLFSYIISVFIKNQKNALDIIEDNIENYKRNYTESSLNKLGDEENFLNLKALIKTTFVKIDTELKEQTSRLKVLQFCNWGVPIGLFTILFIVIVSTLCQEFSKGAS